MISQEYYDILQQPHRELSVRLFLLNASTMRTVGNLEGAVTGGNISISSTSDIRRTANISLIIKNSTFLVGSNKMIWMDKLVNIVLILRNIRTGENVEFNMGYYTIDAPSVRYSASEKTLSFQALDSMMLLTERRNGELGIATKITANTPITSAIRSTISSLGGINNVIIEETNRQIPYDLEFQANSTVYEILKKIQELFMDTQIYFDENNIFHYESIKSHENDPIIVDFSQMYKKLILSCENIYDFSNVRNTIVVWGRQLDNGTQITFEKSNEDINSPFNINSSIGEIKKVIVDDKIQTLEQAEVTCDYYLYKHNNLCEKLTLEIVPVYFLDVNMKVHYENPALELSGDYLITDLNISLDINSSMTVSTIKLFY